MVCWTKHRLPLLFPPTSLSSSPLEGSWKNPCLIYIKKGDDRKKKKTREREGGKNRDEITLHSVPCRVLRNSSSCAPWLGLRVSGLKGHATCYLISQAGTDRRYFAHKQSYVRVTLRTYEYNNTWAEKETDRFLNDRSSLEPPAKNITSGPPFSFRLRLTGWLLFCSGEAAYDR